MNSDLRPLIELAILIVGMGTTLGLILGLFWFITAWDNWQQQRKLRRTTWTRWYTEESIRREIEVSLAERGYDFSDPRHLEYERKRLGAP